MSKWFFYTGQPRKIIFLEPTRSKKTNEQDFNLWNFMFVGIELMQEGG